MPQMRCKNNSADFFGLLISNTVDTLEPQDLNDWDINIMNGKEAGKTNHPSRPPINKSIWLE